MGDVERRLGLDKGSSGATRDGDDHGMAGGTGGMCLHTAYMLMSTMRMRSLSGIMVSFPVSMIVLTGF